MNYDYIFMTILAALICRLVKKWSLVDFVFSFWVAAILYILVKGVVLGLGWGWTFPMSQDLKGHLISGLVSFFFWVVVFAYRVFRPLKK